MHHCKECAYFLGSGKHCEHSADCLLVDGGIPTWYVPKENKIDMVNDPPHYERKDAMECIDEMINVFGESVVADFCLCNVWKYRYRAADKNGAEDISKSDWYMRKYIELKTKSIDKLKKIPITLDNTLPNVINCNK